MKHAGTWIRLTAAAALALTIMLAAIGCGGGAGAADELVTEADDLRVSATDKFRTSTASMDVLIKNAASGQALPASLTKETTEAAMADMKVAVEELTLRDRKLRDARGLEVGEKYKEYLAFLRQSNDKLTETINLAQQVPFLLQQEQFALAGWDEIKTKSVVGQVRSMQDMIQQSYNESEQLRGRAEQIKRDNPEDF